MANSVALAEFGDVWQAVKSPQMPRQRRLIWLPRCIYRQIEAKQSEEIHMGQYSNLTSWLKDPKLVVLSFEQIEEIIGTELPESARTHRPWWGNETGNPSRQCSAWMDAGWEVDKVDLKNRMVRFKKM